MTYGLYALIYSFITTSKVYILLYIATLFLYNLLLNRIKTKYIINLIILLIPLQLFLLTLTNIRTTSVASGISLLNDESIFSLDYLEIYSGLDNNIKILFLMLSLLFRIQGPEPLLLIISSKEILSQNNFLDLFLGFKTNISNYYSDLILGFDTQGTLFSPSILGSLYIPSKSFIVLFILFFIYLLSWRICLSYFLKLNLRSLVIFLPFFYCLVAFTTSEGFQVIPTFSNIIGLLFLFIPFEIELLKIEKVYNV